jgi:hypothetical protein
VADQNPVVANFSNLGESLLGAIHLDFQNCPGVATFIAPAISLGKKLMTNTIRDRDPYKPMRQHAPKRRRPFPFGRKGARRKIF